jgi:hypothetical protein
MHNPIGGCAMRRLLATIVPFLVFAAVSGSETLINVTTPMTPPSWAFKEHALILENARYMNQFAEKYVNPVNGYLECVEHWGGQDGPDDAMENYYNWPLLYALGGPRESLDLFQKVWNGHIRQYSNLGMYYREYITSFDWEHNGEGYAAFNLLPLSDPVDRKTRDRFVRFADFYTGRDKTVDNYDPKNRIIRSILNGSKGVKLKVTAQDWGGHEYWTKSGDWTRVGGDVTMNLLSTTLAVNAWILSGDDVFRDWALEYAGAWADRTAENNGIVPSDIGLDGKIGSGWNGKWYGGLMGWNWVFGGFSVLNRGVRVGFGNAYLLSGGEERFITPMRTLGDVLLANRKDGKFPERYNEKGWFDYGASPLFGSYFADLYLWTLDEKDRSRLEDAYTLASLHRPGGYETGGEIDWIKFLEGANPNYPEQALDSAFQALLKKSTVVRSDTSTPDTRTSDSTHSNGAYGIVTSALINLTLGGIQPLWSGGILRCEFRYFDPSAQRPGLPEDVGALVTSIKPGTVKVILVNTCQTAERDVILQCGAYGENKCISVTVNGETQKVDDRRFTIRLGRGAGAELVVERTRFALKPTYAFPWHEGKIPGE